MASGGASPAPSILGGIEGDSPFQTNHGLSNLNPNSVPASKAAPSVKICVFCGASPGKSPAHMAAARSLATVMAANNISLVYGGGTVGLMGEVARTLVSLSGPESVHGIIPAPLVKYERGPHSDAASVHTTDGQLPEYTVYGKTTVVKDMHTRKQMMAREVLDGAQGSGFLALSGGYGTLEELMEVVTWNQLGIHSRGVVVLNIEGYWDGLLDWVKGSVKAGFVGEGTRDIIAEAKTAEEAIKELREYKVSQGRFKLEWS
ncbi:hypothetical protein OIDMADRAFT_205553 [Oidiodendron maius Zn]|uniref:Cytokinin riboside 5'-monophosphate phosphoribohydrolase n=1 Tax=Oidiodendron maius (strain Zn) TaxID=913774 RepID=A0A0C3CAM7_OIDMZ|nr:hypothetical protein OIDMADRAFT_205553 [Oidiodendron maius Zn]